MKSCLIPIVLTCSLFAQSQPSIKVIPSAKLNVEVSENIQEQTAEVTVPKTYLRKSPNSSAKVVRVLLKGERVTFLKLQPTNAWYPVSVMNGKIKGWINENTIKL